MKVGVYQNSPKIYVDEHSKVSGFWPDLIENIAAKEHWKIEYKKGTWSEGLARLSEGEIDIMPDVAFTEERNKRYIFSDTPEILSWTRVYVHKNNTSIKSITDLQDKKIAVLKNSVNVDGENGLRDIVRQFNLHAEFVEMDDYQHVFKAIEGQTVDAGITNRNYGNHNAHAYEVKKTPIIFQPIGMRFAFSPNSPLTPYLVKRINAEIAELQNDGASFYYQLLKKYFEAEIAVRQVKEIPGWIKLSLQILLVALLFFGIVIVISRLQVKRKTIALKNNERLLKQEISKLNAVQNQLRTLSQAVEQAGESIIITDKEGVIKYVNPAFTKITGYALDDAIGKTARILTSNLQDEHFRSNMIETLLSGNIFQGKILDRRKDGSSYPILLTVSPIKNELDEIISYVAIQQDLSEYQKLEDQFLQAQKMEAVGTLVGGIAHDFNNMLAGITGNLYLAKHHASEVPELLTRLDVIETISFRAAAMIQQLLAFARKSRVVLKPLPMTTFIKEATDFLRSSLPENIAFHQEVCTDPLQINGDRTQLHQMLMNLINNARDALGDVDNPCITVKLDKFLCDEKFIERHPDLRQGEYAHLSVADNGSGIPESIIEHLFEPFFTTKEQGKGTGLGLAMVFGAVKTHQGAIDVESNLGQGTSFHIYLPLLKRGEIESSLTSKKIVDGHGELILLVDDQQTLIDIGREVLTSLGYKVLTATNGQQAVETYKAHTEKIKLIIMDVIMPVMGGSQAAENIRQINPQVKIIFSTGYDKDTQSNMVNESVITKPFQIAKMSKIISQQLNA
ncbi:MAG: transporter substrate-binding domain-containing protein [Mariprofundaceae bacterium]|nr:transporter substrate-binding domain-containing protein [Mariprofundaceae bacterium]